MRLCLIRFIKKKNDPFPPSDCGSMEETSLENTKIPNDSSVMFLWTGNEAINIKIRGGKCFSETP